MFDGPVVLVETRMTWLLFALGLGLLVIGASLLVDNASKIGARLGISQLVVGLTIVAFGSSSPELAVSLRSALAGQSEMAVGNIVGSNVFNVLLILGVAALITPLVVDRKLIRQEIPWMAGVSVLVFVLALDGRLSRIDGTLLFTLLIGYLWLQLRQARKGSVSADSEATIAAKSLPIPILGLAAAIGLGLLVWGANLLVGSATEIAGQLGVSNVIIGLTVIAAGTSLPEVATSVVAALRGQRDIAVGNVVGSNLFNLLAVGGLSALLSSDGLLVTPAVASFDLPVMVVVALACLPVVFTAGRIDRWEGAMFLIYYLAYTTYLILYAQEHDHLRSFQTVMIWVVMPFTVATAAALYFRDAKAGGRAGER